MAKKIRLDISAKLSRAEPLENEIEWGAMWYRLGANPKTKRSLDSKLPILLTVRATKSVLCLPKTFKFVSELIDIPEGTQFWLYRPHTRIVRGWQKAFRVAKDYIELNRLEAEGFISRRETKTLKDLRMIWADG